MKINIFIIAALFTIFCSCRKEGLSKTTGNLEVVIKERALFQLKLLTELEFNSYNNGNIFYATIKEWISENKRKDGTYIYTTSGLPSGFYGLIIIYPNGPILKKSIYIVPKKINSFTY